MGNFFFGNKYVRTRIDTPYKNVSTDELLSRFRTEEWSKLDQTERVNTFQELENRYAVEQKRPVAKIEAETNSSYYGSYSSGNNVIRINMNDDPENNSYEQLDSYYHESRHAHQHQAIKTGKGLDETTRNMCNVEFSARNYVGGGPDYDIQTSEMDSNNTASNRLLEHHERYEDDPEYQKYLERRQAHFEKVNNQCDTEKTHRIERQEKMTERSHTFGAISDKQASQIKKHIASGETDPVVSESREVEQRIRSQNAALKEDSANSENSRDQVTAKNAQEKHNQFFNGSDAARKSGERFYNTRESNATSSSSQEIHSQFFEGNGSSSRSSLSEGSYESKLSTQTSSQKQVNNM